MINKAPVNLEAVSNMKKSLLVQETATLPECKEVALINANHASPDDSNEDMIRFEKITLLLSKCFKVNVFLIQSDKVHHTITAVLDTEAGLNFVRTRLRPASFTPWIRPMITFSQSARDSTFKVRGVILLSVSMLEEK